MGGSNESTKGGGWKTTRVVLPNGIIVALQGVAGPDDGPDGTGAGEAATGSLYIEGDPGDPHAFLYQNTGTKDEPVWTKLVGTQPNIGDLQGLADGQIIVGTPGNPQGKTLSGDVTMNDLAQTSALNTFGNHGIGGEVSDFDKAASGANPIYQQPEGSRIVHGLITVTESFDDGDGAQPTFKLGDGTSAELFVAAAELTDKPVGTKIPFAGRLQSNRPLTVTATAGTGATETGAIRIDWFATYDLD